MRLFLQGRSGSGKTLAALRIAAGLTQGRRESIAVIDSVRTKTDYILTDKNGKMVAEKVGLKGI